MKIGGKALRYALLIACVDDVLIATSNEETEKAISQSGGACQDNGAHS